MKVLKIVFKWFLYVLLIPIIYLVISLLLSSITIDRKDSETARTKTIYLNTNGVHLDVILLKKDINVELLKSINHSKTENYISFGWGDENFYINTPTWSDLTFNNAFTALFLRSSALMHVTRYKHEQSNWMAIEINEKEFQKLNKYLLNTFKTDNNGNKILLKDKGYSNQDDFYKASGSYSCFKTCNSWVNSGFKESGLKSCLWTPFDFGLIKKYE